MVATPHTSCTTDDLPGLVSLKAAVDARLATLLPPATASGASVSDAMRTCVLAPGKRLRPLLLILTAQDLGVDQAAVIDLGCAIEMVHAASLILDDMPCMDNALMRRGQPATHVGFGEDVAILAAVALLSHAFKSVASVPGLASSIRAELTVELSNSVGTQGLVMGQYEDLREGAHSRSLEQIAQTNALKTSMLFRAAVSMAAIVAEADLPTRQSLNNYADEMGQAYQLLDDLKDVGQVPVDGKDICKDVGKSTLIGALGSTGGRSRLLVHARRAAHCLSELRAEPQGNRSLLRAIFPHEFDPLRPTPQKGTPERQRAVGLVTV